MNLERSPTSTYISDGCGSGDRKQDGRVDSGLVNSQISTSSLAQTRGLPYGLEECNRVTGRTTRIPGCSFSRFPTDRWIAIHEKVNYIRPSVISLREESPLTATPPLGPLPLGTTLTDPAQRILMLGTTSYSSTYFRESWKC